MKPVIVYVDDEPNNLTVFEAALPDDYEVKVFDSPIQALNRLEEIRPWVVMSDQRMPSMKGVECLELVRKLAPQAVRIIVTGFSEEDLVIESVRKAQVFDYIRKPWDVSDLLASLTRAVDFHRLSAEREALFRQFSLQKAEMEAKTEKLTKLTVELELAARRERDTVQELECWVPPYVLWALKHPDVRFPMKKKLVGLTFDIVGSSRIHGLVVKNKPLRARVIEVFSEVVLRNGGWRESHAGDSAYAHFGLEHEESYDPFEAALASAKEFRVAIRSLAMSLGVELECGIALHVAKEAVVDVHRIQLSTPRGIVTQKSFDTTSSDIDLLHRIEKLVHDLPGSNIVMSKEFVAGLRRTPEKALEIGKFELRGQADLVELSLIPSDRMSEQDLLRFLQKHQYKSPLTGKSDNQAA